MSLPRAFSPEILAELLAELSAKARAEIRKPAITYDPRNAELLPDVTPRWHVVAVWPGAERKVEAELVARRFGIFIPETEQRVVSRGRVVDRRELMFPGYIFAFVWDVLQHRSRIEAITGVERVVLDVNGAPLFLTDEEIDKVRAVENGERAALPPIKPHKPTQRRKSRKSCKRLKGRGRKKHSASAVGGVA